jgi:hypothetical protein
MEYRHRTYHDNQIVAEVQAPLLRELDLAETKAIDSLARYKFQMFGYWAAIWVHLNRISGANRSNPFKKLVLLARKSKEEQ